MAEPPADGRRAVLAGEWPRLILAFVAFFLLLCSYYILRPVRDEMGVRTGVGRIQWLFTGTFAFTVLIIPAFGWVVKRLPRTLLVPVVYGFLVANLVGFAVAFLVIPGLGPAVAFFIWLSVFNLFVNSLFWSAASDTFTTEEAHRLYGYIAAGGTAGAITGPALTAVLARGVGTSTLLLLSATLLAVAGASIWGMRRRVRRTEEGAGRPIGGSVVAGVPLTLKLASLRGVALLVICYSAVSTALYVELVDLVGKRSGSAGERTAFFATVDLTVNLLALAMQLFGTKRLVRRYGLRVALSIVPAVVATGLGALVVALGIKKSAVAVAAVQTANRVGDYALMRPGREMIFTTVDPESRYKAKSFIDTTVYRASDALWAWLVAVIRAAGLSAIALAAVPAALLWLVTGFRVGRRHDHSEST